MTRKHHHRWLSSLAPVVVAIAAGITTAAMVNPVLAQNPDWRIVENPYQEDIEYSIGTTHAPMIEVDGIRWRSFSLERPDFDLVGDDETVDTKVVFEFENRRTKSVKILVILLLEDENGDPIDRITAKPFKLTGGRLKERKETAKLNVGDLKAARRVYLFFEILK